MFKKLRLPALLVGAALTLLTPSMALARNYEREHHRRFSVYFGYGPSYGYGYYGPYGGYGYYRPYRYYYRPYGFYDRWGYWHPY